MSLAFLFLHIIYIRGCFPPVIVPVLRTPRMFRFSWTCCVPCVVVEGRLEFEGRLHDEHPPTTYFSVVTDLCVLG